MTLEERVARGVKLLDQECPGWADRIDLDKLDLGGCHRCILGQLYRDFWDAPFSLRYDHDADADINSRRPGTSRGFNALTFEDYETVTNAWWKLIQKRRENITPSLIINQKGKAQA